MNTPKDIRYIYEKIADEVIAGKWGRGYQLQLRLTNAGYDYEKIMRILKEKRKHV